MAAGGAEHLFSIFGTEKDKVNCPFYYKIGACRHEDKCERRHNRPTLSQTMLLKHMYQNPLVSPDYNEEKAQEEFEEFYEDIFEELSKFGPLEELNIANNICEHMLGNVYVKFYSEDDADKALKALNGRFYAGRPIVGELSPVTDFREASCRQFENNECTRGGHCNFMHLKAISRDLYKKLFGERKRSRRSRRSRSRSRDRRSQSRSRSRERKHKHSSRRSKSRSRSRDRQKDKEAKRSRSDSKERERSKSSRPKDRESRSKEDRESRSSHRSASQAKEENNYSQEQSNYPQDQQNYPQQQ